MSRTYASAKYGILALIVLIVGLATGWCIARFATVSSTVTTTITVAVETVKTITSITSITVTKTLIAHYTTTVGVAVQKLTTATSNAIKITDFRGKVIILPSPAKRIVVLNSYWAETLVALGAIDRIVGIGKWVAYDEYLPAAVRAKPIVGDVFRGVDIEKLISLKPDVVVMDYGYGKANEIIEQIERVGIPVVALLVKSFLDEVKAVEILGKVVGAEDRAEKLIEFMLSRYNAILEKARAIPEDRRLRVVMVSGYSILRGGALTLYANTSWGRAIEDVGAINIALREFPGKKWPKVDIETLLKWNPDAVIITSSVSSIQRVLDKISSSELWRSLKAFKTGRIYVVPCWSRIGGVLDWGPRDIIGREYIATILYPDIYRGLDWRKDMETLLKEFYRVFIPEQAFASYSIEWKEVVDLLGYKVKIPRKVSRIVDLIAYQTMLAFKAMDKLVGVSKYAARNPVLKVAYPNITKIPSPGSSFSINVEKLAALKPDIVILWPYRTRVVEEIERLGIPVIRVQLYSFNDIKRLLWLLGVILDERERAKELIEDIDSIVSMVEKRVESIPPDQRVRVLYLWSKPTRVQGGRGTVNDFIALAGGINVAANDFPDKAYVSIDIERIVKWNPDVIVIWYYARYNRSTILSNPILAAVNAVKSGRVYREPYYEHWNMDAALFVLWLAKKMYPEEFSDIDFLEVANKYYEKWYGVTYEQVAAKARQQ